MAVFFLLRNTTHHYQALYQISESAEKSLTEKKFTTNKQTNKQPDKHSYSKGKNYIPPIYFIPGGGGINISWDNK